MVVIALALKDMLLCFLILKGIVKVADTAVANVYEIGGVKYTVVSHYVGEKDIDDVILKLAESSAYADMDAASA